VTADRAGDGRVVTRTFSGASTRVLVALPDGTEVRVDLPSAVSGDLTPGTAVTVRPAERPVLVAPPEPTATIGDATGSEA
jgi:putative spermidine/putrescine transport system ATP-binding protein